MKTENYPWDLATSVSLETLAKTKKKKMNGVGGESQSGVI